MSFSDKIRHKPWIGWVLFLTTAVVVFFLGLLASSIIERRTEAQFAFTPVISYDQSEPRNAVWGNYFPREYQSYLQTSDTSFRSKYNGAAMIDMLETDPRLVVLWAGYGFSKDYNQGRGHYYAITDIRKTLRTGAPSDGKPSPMPNTCWACKSTDVPRMMKVTGPAEFYSGTWDTKGHEIVNAIGCADCHEAKTMNLQISRPALKEAFERSGKDITKVSHQEMRSLVCAQCHVEYYFDKRDGRQNYLTFPWDKGLTADDMERYYDEFMFSDWTHALSRAPMLKAQHPDWEVYMTGIHAERGVSCADCHMPYKSEGGQKFTDHHLQSPLNNVEASCAVCHREKTLTLIKNVYDRQDKIIQNRDKLEELLVRAHVEAKKAWDLGAGEDQMKDILMDIRHAQWRWDYSAASHGASFHAPVETGRVVATGITIAQEARIKLARLLASKGFNEEVPYPDIATKEKAQAFIGLNMADLVDEKDAFLKEVVPVWDRKASEREALYPAQ
ncbi:MAG: ammonia-forming cytochrome c nitrite reductase [Bacteroidales bacterium]|jgi:nitrite reductase (cytochrome c-552)|nr:ammonia-forming cytochrome c nitrite reductase [Bacteroidales bacterium]